MLAGLINIECDFVKTNFGPKLEANPNDYQVAQWIFKFMLIGKCTDDPLWLEAGKVVNKNNPDFGIAKNIGLKSKANGDKADAEKYFNQALGLAKADSDKADMLVQLGHLKAEAGAKSAARDLYRKAHNTDTSNSEPFTYIGNLYFRSFDDCAGKEDKAKDRLVFIAAYNMFKKSGNAKLMNAAKEQFPSKEELFERNYNSGDAMTVGCWINESVILDTRD
jgi:tetratricopeptide (TPR) repeat protein